MFGCINRNSVKRQEVVLTTPGQAAYHAAWSPVCSSGHQNTMLILSEKGIKQNYKKQARIFPLSSFAGHSNHQLFVVWPFFPLSSQAPLREVSQLSISPPRFRSTWNHWNYFCFQPTLKPQEISYKTHLSSRTWYTEAHRGQVPFLLFPPHPQALDTPATSKFSLLCTRSGMDRCRL